MSYLLINGKCWVYYDTQNCKNYITPYVGDYNFFDGWKMMDWRENRQGTYDKYLNRFKD